MELILECHVQCVYSIHIIYDLLPMYVMKLAFNENTIVHLCTRMKHRDLGVP